MTLVKINSCKGFILSSNLLLIFRTPFHKNPSGGLLLIERFLSNASRGFRKAHSTQHVLFQLLQSWQKEQGNGGFVGTNLMYLSKSSDHILHEASYG